jgi:hypothetical protein
MTDYSYIGVGKVHMRVKDSAAALVHVGNCSALNFAIEEETKELKDFTQAGGGTYNEVRRVSGVTCAMSLHDISPDNLAKAIFGDVNAIAAGSVSNENVGAVYAGGISVTDYPIDTASTVTVKHAEYAASARANSTAYAEGDYYLPASPNGYVYKCTVAGTSAGSPPSFSTTMGATFADGTATMKVVGITAALTADTHFTASAGGVTFDDTSPSIVDGEEAIVSYTKDAGSAVEALLNSAQEYELFFDGLNEARSGKATTVHAYRVKIGAGKDLSLIGEDYAVLELEGKVLKDTSKNGTSVSQYFKAQIVS